MVKGIKFEGVYGALEAKICFQRVSKKNFILVFMLLLASPIDRNSEI